MLTHVTVATVGRLALARDEPQGRRVVQALASFGPKGLLCFGFADDHLHFAVRSRRARLFARDVRRRLLSSFDGLQLQSPHLVPIDSRRHLLRVVTYQLRQPAKHQLRACPALWTGSCFLDLIGARALPGFDASALMAELPRLRARALYEAVGLDSVPLALADDEALHGVGAVGLCDLAASVLAVGPVLSGRCPQVVEARALAVHLAREAGVPSSELRRAMGVTQSTTWRLARRPLNPRALRAARLRLALEARLDPYRFAA